MTSPCLPSNLPATAASLLACPNGGSRCPNLQVHCAPLKRALAFAALAAMLASAASASAAFQPVRRSFGEVTVPRIRAGTLRVPNARAHGRVTVIVRLKQPPLAAWYRTLSGRSGSARMNARSSSARAYLRTLAAQQAAAVRQLKAAVPQARVSRHFSVLLNGFAVQLPASSLPRVLQ